MGRVMGSGNTTGKIDRTRQARRNRRLLATASASVMAATLMGYTRNAYAQACTGTAPNYTCTGTGNMPILINTNNASLTTTGTFNVNALGMNQNALEITGYGALSFTDPATSTTTLDAADGTGLRIGVNGNDGVTMTPGSITINTAGTIDGYDGHGIGAYNNGDGGISITTSGAVSAEAELDFLGEPTRYVAGIFAENGGIAAISITTNGTVTGTEAKGIDARQTNISATGGVTVTTNAAVNTYGNFAEGHAINVNSKGTGAVSITANSTVTSASGRGIRAYQTNDGMTGNLTILTNSTVTSERTGIFAYSNSGSGAIDITTGGTVTSNASSGIDARQDNSSATGNLTIVANGAIDSYSHSIRAENQGTGSISITANGAIDSENGRGIRTYQNNSGGGGDITIIANSTIDSYGTGVFAEIYDGGNGAISITTNSTITSEESRGILARHRDYNGYGATGDITIAVNGDINSYARGVDVDNRGTGTVSVTVAGNITNTGDYDGVRVESPNGGASTVTILSGGSVNSGYYGVNLRHGGTVTVQAGATVTSRDNDGVYIDQGVGTIINGGFIQGDSDGVNVDTAGTVINQVGGTIIAVENEGVDIDSGTVINHGRIESLSTDSTDYAIEFDDSDPNTVINSGAIIAAGANAIEFQNDDDILELQPGFEITGNVLAKDGDDLLRFNQNGGAPGAFNLDTIDDGTNTLQFQDFETFQVIGGTWSFTGETGETFSVDGGTLGGNFTVGGLIVNSGGTVAPGASIGTINVTGDVAFNPGSTLAVEIDAAGNADLIAATGMATISPNNTTLAITGTPGNFTYTFLTAGGGITGQFSNIVDNIPDLDFSQLISGGNGQLVLAPSTDGNTSRKEIHPSSLAAGMDAARMFSQTLRRRGGLHAGGLTYNLGGSLEALGYLPGSDAPKSLPPHVLAADAPDLPVEAVSLQPKRWGVWAAAMGGLSDTDNDGAIPGWDARSGGLVIGAEHYFQGTGIPVLVGLAGGYSMSDVDSTASNADVASWHGGLYAAAEAGALTVSGSVSYAWQDYDMSRRITFGGATVRANGDADGSSLTASAEAFLDASRFAAPLAGSGIGLGPIATLDAVFAERDGFTETGAGLLNLTVGSDDANQAITGLGLAATVSQMVNGMRLTGDARVVWEHVFGDDHVTSGSAIPAVAGATFTTRSAAIDRDRLAAGIGAALDVSEMVSMHVRYDGAVSDSTTDHRGAAGVTVRF